MPKKAQIICTECGRNIGSKSRFTIRRHLQKYPDCGILVKSKGNPTWKPSEQTLKSREALENSSGTTDSTKASEGYESEEDYKDDDWFYGDGYTYDPTGLHRIKFAPACQLWAIKKHSPALRPPRDTPKYKDKRYPEMMKSIMHKALLMCSQKGRQNRQYGVFRARHKKLVDLKQYDRQDSEDFSDCESVEEFVYRCNDDCDQWHKATELGFISD